MKVFCVLIFVAWSWTGRAQDYEFIVSAEPYQPLVNGTSATKQVWDDPNLSFPIGFPFQYYGQVFTSIQLSSYFTEIVLSDTPESDTMSLIIPFGADLIDKGYTEGIPESPITYKTVGSAGNREFILQFENAGFYYEWAVLGTTTNTVNFQVRFYEASGDIKFHYGPASVPLPEYAYDTVGPYVGIMEEYDFFFGESLGDVMLLSGDPQDPQVNPSFGLYYIDGTIPANTLYHFTTGITDVSDPEPPSSGPWFLPTITKGPLELSADRTTEILSDVQIMHTTGLVDVVKPDHSRLDLSDYPPGIYQLCFETRAGLVMERILRIE